MRKKFKGGCAQGFTGVDRQYEPCIEGCANGQGPEYSDVCRREAPIEQELARTIIAFIKATSGSPAVSMIRK